MLDKKYYLSQEIFKKEQAVLSRNAWHFVGFKTDLSNHNDYISANIFGQSVFVQNFKGELKGFINACAHRFYPLRTNRKGNGPLRCSFHGWSYNNEGYATGIPLKKKIFCLDDCSKQNLSLVPIDIDFCGEFVFAKLPSSAYTETLQEFLGSFFTIVERISLYLGNRYYERAYDVKSNWKLFREISTDEYHIVDVHPTTFGLEGHLPTDDQHLQYHYTGAHSAMLVCRHEPVQHLDALRKTLLEDNTLPTHSYNIFHIFPFFLVVALPKSLFVHYMEPMAADKSIFHSLMFDYNHKNPELKPYAEVPLSDDAKKKMSAMSDTVNREDKEVTEKLMPNLHLQWKQPIYSKLEERIEHFHKAYLLRLNANG